MKPDSRKTKAELIAELQSARDNEENYRRLFNRAPLGYQSLDSEGNIITVNDTWLQLLGYKQEEVVGKWFGDFLAPDYIDHFKQNFPNFKNQGAISGVQFQMMTRAGLPIHVEFEGRIGINSDGKFQQTHCILRDISDDQKHELELLQHKQSLEKRVAELNCLYQILRSLEKPKKIIEEMLEEVVNIIPSGWQFPEITTARIQFDKKDYYAPNWNLTEWNQKSDIYIFDKLYGFIQVCYLEQKPEADEGPFLAEERNLIDAITYHLRNFFIRRNIEDQINRHREILQHLTDEMINTQEAERKRISRELHDETGQMLTAIRINIVRLREGLKYKVDPKFRYQLNETSDLVDKLLVQLKDIAFELRPSMIDDLGLIPTLKWLIEKTMKQTGLEIDMKISGIEDRISEKIDLILFRCIQEAITNTVKYAEATTINISIIKFDNLVKVVIIDDGKGFDINKKKVDNTSHLGLIGMSERIAASKGLLEIDSNPETGTKLEIEIPL